MPSIDISGIVGDVIAGIILIVTAAIIPAIWQVVTYTKNKKFEKQFTFAKSASKINSNDFLFKGFLDYYLRRNDIDSDNEGEKDKRLFIIFWTLFDHFADYICDHTHFQKKLKSLKDNKTTVEDIIINKIRSKEDVTTHVLEDTQLL